MRKLILIAAIAASSLGLISCSETNTTTGDLKVTANGLKYKIVKDVDDSTAKVGNILELYLTARTEKDSILGSTYQRNAGPDLIPITPPSRSMDLMGGLTLLSAGDSAIFYLPTDSMFFGNEERRPPYFPKGSYVCYHIKVKSRLKDRSELITRQNTQLKEFAATKGLKVEEDNGVMYAITEKKSTSNALPGDSILVSYKGTKLDGQVFDESTGRGPYGLVLGKSSVIQGWTQGLTHFGKGDKGYLLINSDLGYGDQGDGVGVIPPFTPLIFEIEIADLIAKKK